MLAVSDKVSDLIFSPGRAPQVELAGNLQSVKIPGLEKLTPAHTGGIVAKLILGNQENANESLEKTGSADLSFSAPSEGRFRVNIFKQRGTHAIVMRVIPAKIPRLTTLSRLKIQSNFCTSTRNQLSINANFTWTRQTLPLPCGQRCARRRR